MPPDHELVQRTQWLDDRVAYTELVRRYQSSVRAFLFRRTRNREWADDLAQEVFLKAYRHLHQLSEGESFRAWLLTIAHREFLQSHRARPKSEDATPDFESLLSGSNEAGRVTAPSELRSLLKTLRPIEQEAILLCFGHEFSHSEAAKILELPVGTVKSLVLRAREKLIHSPTNSSSGGSRG